MPQYTVRCSDILTSKNSTSPFLVHLMWLRIMDKPKAALILMDFRMSGWTQLLFTHSFGNILHWQFIVLKRTRPRVLLCLPLNLLERSNETPLEEFPLHCPTIKQWDTGQKKIKLKLWTKVGKKFETSDRVAPLHWQIRLENGKILQIFSRCKGSLSFKVIKKSAYQLF